MNLLFVSVFAVLNGQSIESDLQGLNVVHSCEVVSKIQTPKQTIIHLNDWHWISKEDYNSDKAANGTDGLPATYAKFVESVRKVQAEQEAVLRMLIAKHGIKSVYKEGMTIDDAAIDAAVQGIAWSKENRKKGEYDSLRLSLGIAGKLKADGLLKDVKPCESLKLMLDCNPFDEDGKPRDVPDKALEAREQFIVDQIVKGKEKLSVVILGGAHDLSNNVPKGVRLIEVTLKGYRDVVPE